MAGSYQTGALAQNGTAGNCPRIVRARSSLSIYFQGPRAIIRELLLAKRDFRLGFRLIPLDSAHDSGAVSKGLEFSKQFSHKFLMFRTLSILALFVSSHAMSDQVLKSFEGGGAQDLLHMTEMPNSLKRQQRQAPIYANVNCTRADGVVLQKGDPGYERCLHDVQGDSSRIGQQPQSKNKSGLTLQFGE